MDRSDQPDNNGKRRRQRLSWLSAFTFWVALSIAGWAMIVSVFTLIGPEQASQVATEEEADDLKEFAPAAGPGSDDEPLSEDHPQAEDDDRHDPGTDKTMQSRPPSDRSGY